MRILICNPYISLGGISTYTLSLAYGLKKNGNEILFLTTHYKGDQWGKAGEMFDKTLTLDKFKSPILKIIKIIKLVKRIEPHVVLINDCPLVNYSLPFISKKIGVLSVIHSDSKRYYSLGSRFSGWIDKLICPSPALAIKISDFIPTNYKKKIVIIPHGVRLPSAAEKQDKITNSIAFIGNLDGHKGVRILPEILENVSNEIKNIRIYIVGRGPLKEWLIDEIKKRDLEKSLNYYVELDNNSLYELLTKIEILLLPTRLESFGLVILEAMVNGVIPVISRLNLITDQFVNNGVTGFLCDKDIPEEFSERIVQILRNENLKRSISEKAQEFSRSHYSIDQMTQQYQIAIAGSASVFRPKPLSPRWIGLFMRDLLQLIRNNTGS